MKRHTFILLSLALIAGCQDSSKPVDSKKKLSAQWNSARAGVQYSLARQEYESGDLVGSRKNVDQAISLNPTFGPALILSAKLSIEKGDLGRAEQTLAAARTADPKNAEPDYYMGVVYQRWQKLTQALDSYTHATEKSPDDLSYLLARAETLVSLDRAPEALSMLQEKASFFESSPAIRDAIGQILQQKGDYAAAADMFRHASLLSSEDQGIRERLAIALFYAKQYIPASEQLVLLTRQPAYQHRADLLTALGECQLQFDSPRDARASFESAAQAAPSQTGAWIGLAKAAMALKDDKRADLSLRRAIALTPDNSQVHLLIGYLKLQQNHPTEALSSFQKAHTLDPKDTVALCMLGCVEEKLGHPDQALQFYAQALQQKPKDELASKLMASVDLHE